MPTTNRTRTDFPTPTPLKTKPEKKRATKLHEFAQTWLCGCAGSTRKHTNPPNSQALRNRAANHEINQAAKGVTKWLIKNATDHQIG